jgi:yeast amino acid transporter
MDTHTKETEDIEAHSVPRDSFNVDDLKNTDFEQRNVGTLDRKLKSRHIQFLALSGAIGTGLFVGSGQVLSLAGPLSMFLAYLITGFNLFCVIQSLGEMGKIFENIK